MMIVKEFVTGMLHASTFWEQKGMEKSDEFVDTERDKLHSVNDDDGILTRESHFVTKTDYEEQTLI